MKYLSLSLITTGFDPIKNDILEIGAIVEDTGNKLPYDEIPKLRFWIDREYYRGNPLFLTKYNHIFEKINQLRVENSRRLVKSEDAITKLSTFLRSHFSKEFKLIPITVAGKNFSSNYTPFLSRLKGYDSIPFHSRILDPTMCVVDWGNDEYPPSMNECKERLGLEDDDCEADDSLRNSWDVIKILRSQY